MEDMKKVGPRRWQRRCFISNSSPPWPCLLACSLATSLILAADSMSIPKHSMPGQLPNTRGKQKRRTSPTFWSTLFHNTVVDAFSKGDILQVLLVSVLFGFALSIAGPRCKPLLDVMDSLTRAVFGVVAILMRFAPIGAFGAMAFITIGKYGLASLGPLVKLIANASTSRPSFS